MKTTFTVKVNPALRAVRRMVELNAADMKRITGIVDTKFRANERRLFSSEGASGGGRWARLSPAYAEAKRRAFAGIAERHGKKAARAIISLKILQRSGAMRRSLVEAGHSKHVAVYSVSQKTVTVGTRSDVAAYHAAGSGRLPKRDPVAHTPAQLAEYGEEVTQRVLRPKLERVRRVLGAWKFVRGGGV